MSGDQTVAVVMLAAHDAAGKIDCAARKRLRAVDGLC
jgi:hypothetical protein